MQLRMLAILALMASMLISFQPATPVTTAATSASVAEEAGVLFSDDFEAASLGPNWSVETENEGVVELDTRNPQSGTQSVFIGQNLAASREYAALILAIDLSGQTDVFMDYWVRANDNETREGMRVSISDNNGTNWTEIQNLDHTGQTYSHQLIDLARAAEINNLTLNDQFRIRFHYNGTSYGDASDGMVLDDLRLSRRADVVASFPLAQESFEGTTFAQGFYPQSSRNGVVELDTNNPQSGAQSVFIGQRLATSGVFASLILAIDLSGQTDVFMDYWVRANDNGTREGMRVSISDDNGTNWTEIQNLDNTGRTYSHQLIDLANLAQINGLTLNNQFRIRFHYNGYSYGDANDGMVLDNLRLSRRADVVASFPLAQESFEGTTFAQGFYPQSFTNGVVELDTNNPQSGTQSVFIGQRLATSGVFASLILAIDLSGQTDVFMDYWVRDNDNESREGMRVSISDDNGANWTQIQSLDDTGQTYSHQLIDLANLAQINGLTLNNQFRIRFHYNGYSYGDANDGMVIDDLRISGSAPSFTVYMPLLRR